MARVGIVCLKGSKATVAFGDEKKIWEHKGHFNKLSITKHSDTAALNICSDWNICSRAKILGDRKHQLCTGGNHKQFPWWTLWSDLPHSPKRQWHKMNTIPNRTARIIEIFFPSLSLCGEKLQRWWLLNRNHKDGWDDAAQVWPQMWNTVAWPSWFFTAIWEKAAWDNLHNYKPEIAYKTSKGKKKTKHFYMVKQKINYLWNSVLCVLQVKQAARAFCYLKGTFKYLAHKVTSSMKDARSFLVYWLKLGFFLVGWGFFGASL